jgi:hypothetical protein
MIIYFLSLLKPLPLQTFIHSKVLNLFKLLNIRFFHTHAKVLYASWKTFTLLQISMFFKIIALYFSKLTIIFFGVC